MPAGRPIEYTEEVINSIIEKMEKYIEETEIPIVAEFAYKNDIRRGTLYEKPEFSDTIKKMIDKKEANLEKGGLTNKFNSGIVAFSLKQLGWRDRHDLVKSEEIEIPDIDSLTPEEKQALYDKLRSRNR